MEVSKIPLVDGHEPYLATLYGKALDARGPDSILGDAYADDAVQHLDFAFDRLRLPRQAAITLPMRARHLDLWTREFLAAHPVSTVLHLGCGLDTRVYRLDPPDTVRWYDVDLPEVIALRRRLYAPRRSYEMISASVTDPTLLDSVAHDRPVLVVAEGLVMYLPERAGVALFNRITDRFSHGQLVFDAYSTLAVRLITVGSRLTGMPVTLRWGLDDPHRLEREVDRLTLVDAVPFLTMPELVARLSRTRLQPRPFG